jgi:hypothetical protein
LAWELRCGEPLFHALKFPLPLPAPLPLGPTVVHPPLRLCLGLGAGYWTAAGPENSAHPGNSDQPVPRLSSHPHVASSYFGLYPLDPAGPPGHTLGVAHGLPAGAAAPGPAPRVAAVAGGPLPHRCCEGKSGRRRRHLPLPVRQTDRPPPLVKTTVDSTVHGYFFLYAQQFAHKPKNILTTHVSLVSGNAKHTPP